MDLFRQNNVSGYHCAIIFWIAFLKILKWTVLFKIPFLYTPFQKNLHMSSATQCHTERYKIHIFMPRQQLKQDYQCPNLGLWYYVAYGERRLRNISGTLRKHWIV
jgi:hypothetical protein